MELQNGNYQKEIESWWWVLDEKCLGSLFIVDS